MRPEPRSISSACEMELKAKEVATAEYRVSFIKENDLIVKSFLTIIKMSINIE